MGKREIKEQNQDLNVNLVDIINKFDTSKTGKFTNFLVKMFRKSLESELHSVDKNKKLKPKAENGVESILIDYIYHTFNDENLSNLDEYREHLESERLPLSKRDINQIENWDELSSIISIAKIKMNEKKLKKQIITVFEDESYLVIRPLTLEASLTYGAGTRWCTTSKDNPRYFYRYSRNGVLCYVISKEDNKKFGFILERFDTGSDESFSVWNTKDERIDTIESGLPDFLIKMIYTYSKSEKNNYYYFTSEVKKICDDKIKEGEFPIALENDAVPFLGENTQEGRVVDITREAGDELMEF